MTMNAAKVRELFVELLANVPREQWDERLAECAGADEDLRHRVKLLLAAHQEDSFLASPALALGGTIDKPITERPGTVIGPYKLPGAIGGGGFRVLFLGGQEGAKAGKSGPKNPQAGHEPEQVVARFEAE